MRELVYVSDAKLRQLLPGLPHRPGRLREVEAEVKTPLGGVRVGKGAPDATPSLAAAVAALEASPRAPKWFADPSVRPGQWVHFEAPLSYGLLRDSVVFIDLHRASAEYPSGGRLRLLLHGSSHHLLGNPPGRDLERHVRPPAGSLRAAVFERPLPDLAQLEDDAPDDTAAVPRETEELLMSLSTYTREMARLYAHLQVDYTAAWMAGYARVTARIPANSVILAATPLYVEHIDPPEPTTISS